MVSKCMVREIESNWMRFSVRSEGTLDLASGLGGSPLRVRIAFVWGGFACWKAVMTRDDGFCLGGGCSVLVLWWTTVWSAARIVTF